MRNFKKMVFSIVATMLAASIGQAQAGMVTYQIKDIGDFASYSTNNVGQTYSGTGFVGLYETEFAHLFGVEDTSYSRTAMQVDISGLAGKTILGASLDFRILDGSPGTQTVTATTFAANGSLGHVWTPTAIQSQNYSVSNGINSLDVTGLLQQRVSAGANWLGLHLQGSSLYEWTYTYAGDGYSDDRAEVRLNVNYEDAAAVPEPTSIAMWGLGALGMMISVRKRRQSKLTA